MVLGWVRAWLSLVTCTFPSIDELCLVSLHRCSRMRYWQAEGPGCVYVFRVRNHAPAWLPPAARRQMVLGWVLGWVLACLPETRNLFRSSQRVCLSSIRFPSLALAVSVFVEGG